MPQGGSRRQAEAKMNRNALAAPNAADVHGWSLIPDDDPCTLACCFTKKKKKKQGTSIYIIYFSEQYIKHFIYLCIHMILDMLEKLRKNINIEEKLLQTVYFHETKHVLRFQ